MIEELVVLSHGDLTKVPYLLAHVTREEALPYLKRQMERRALDLALLGFLGVKLPWLEEAPRMRPLQQAVGEACGGRMIERCLPVFGDKLFVACRSCPGMSGLN